MLKLGSDNQTSHSKLCGALGYIIIYEKLAVSHPPPSTR